MNLKFILRMAVLDRGLIFQPVILACTYNNDIIEEKKGERRGGQVMTP